MGDVIGAGQAQNVARQAVIGAGIPKETPAYMAMIWGWPACASAAVRALQCCLDHYH